MKVDAQRADARAQRLRQQGQREASAEEAARRFQKQLQRRRKEEDAALTAITGPFDLMVHLRERQEESPALNPSLLVQEQALSEPVAPPAPDLTPAVDPEIVQRHMQDSVRLDTIAHAAMEVGVKVGMAQDSGEYQVELGCALFTRTRLRVRAGDHLGIEVRCESGSASEREWFARHREALAERMASLTGRAVQLDIADLGP